MDDLSSLESLFVFDGDKARLLEDGPTTVAALQELSLVSIHRGDCSRTVSRMEVALARYLKAESSAPAILQLISVVYANLGQLLLAQGNADKATIHAAEAIPRQRELGYS